MAEIEIKKFFERGDFLVVRSCGSFGPVDVIAFNGKAPLAIQVKESYNSSVSVSRDVQKLDELRKKYNVIGTVAVKFKDRKEKPIWVFCNVEKLVENGKTTILKNDEKCVVKRDL